MQTRARVPWRVQKSRGPEFVRDLREYFGFAAATVRGRDEFFDAPSVANFGIYGGLSLRLPVVEKIPARFPGVRARNQRVAAF
jgi:hypothetical protein